MPDGREEILTRVISSINDVPAKDWNACAGKANPFVRHEFLHALELSGSVSAKTGWLPQHLLIDGEDGNLAACMPMYLKNHSYGEYIFDWGWAEAYERAGGKYYPKLQSAVPFTPATGNRMLVRDDLSNDYYSALIASMLQLSRKHNVSSLHVTFPPKAQWDLLGKSGFLLRTSKQFHWKNCGYETFDHFLSVLSSRKRKAIKKERQKVADQGITLKSLSGDELHEVHWDAFYDFYIDTIGRKYGHPYLTRDFFSMIGKTMPELAVLVTAEFKGRMVAGALNLKGKDTIFGRNWGCLEDFKFLHFEACYYQAIDFAIEHKLQWVEAGAQGPHKIQRGYLPREVYSAHWIENKNFRNAVEKFVEQERREVEFEIAGYMQYSPYRSGKNG